MHIYIYIYQISHINICIYIYIFKYVVAKTGGTCGMMCTFSVA